MQALLRRLLKEHDKAKIGGIEFLTPQVVRRYKQHLAGTSVISGAGIVGSGVAAASALPVRSVSPTE